MRHPAPLFVLPFALTALGAACGEPTRPAEGPTADSWRVEPTQLQLGVGDTVQIRVVLFKGRDTLDVRLPHRGGVGTFIYGTALITLEGQTATKTLPYRVAALGPGTAYVSFRYGEYGRCEDPPECFIRPWTDFLPGQDVVVAVQ